ncbi:5556_t:CDS:2, partial [Dentiscutata heterogama]
SSGFWCKFNGLCNSSSGYRDNPKRYGILAKQCADLSTSDTVLYDNHNESNPIQFSKLSDEKLEELKSFISPPATERERPNYASRRTYSSSSIASILNQQ